MNVLPRQKQEMLIRLLVEGNSLRGAARVADVAYNTVLKFLPRVGAACDTFHHKTFVNLQCRQVQIDEIWSFCHTKQKNLTEEKANTQEYGDLWTFVAIDPETKLAISWAIGKRTLDMARVFISDLRNRIQGRMQLSSDGFKPYLTAVDEAFGIDIDYGMLVKIYDNDGTDPNTLNLHTDPKIKSHALIGNPQSISTSAVERQNLTMRQCMRRFTRQTNGHSKRVANHAYAIALHFVFYNYCRIHQTLRITPAMAAGLTDHVWDVNELMDMCDGHTIVT